jgi:hypothetical protein
MRQLRPIAVCLALAACACNSAGLPKFPSGSSPIETGAVPGSQQPVADRSVVASGTPTQVYTLVASGIMRCWFGAGGPLARSHVYQAEAASPADKGPTEIVLHERDASLRDQRGARAFRISFTDMGGDANVGISNLRIAAPVADAMTRDVENWASGGSGCETRTVMPPPAPQAVVAPPKATPGKSVARPGSK